MMADHDDACGDNARDNEDGIEEVISLDVGFRIVMIAVNVRKKHSFNELLIFKTFPMFQSYTN